MNDLISIIVPIFNIEMYLEKCLNSICEQTYKNIEIILIDDGSTDFSGDICDNYALKDSRIKVIHTSNCGVSNARNTGLKSANGEYILFIDGDDFIERNMVKELIYMVYKHNVDVVMFEYNIVCSGKTNKHQGDTELYNSVISVKKAIELTISPINRFAVTKMYSREILKKLKFDTTAFRGEDTWFAINALKNARSVYYTNYAPYHYIQTENSAVRSKYNDKKYSVVIIYEKIIDFCINNYLDLIDVAINAYVGEVLAILYDMHISKVDGSLINNLRNRLKLTIGKKEYKMLTKNHMLQFILCKYAPFILFILKDIRH